jgi:hypothetical protein
MVAMIMMRVLLIAISLGSVLTHEENFVHDVETYERSGSASLKIYPHTDGAHTVYEFQTKQIGVYQRTGFRVAF